MMAAPPSYPFYLSYEAIGAQMLCNKGKYLLNKSPVLPSFWRSGPSTSLGGGGGGGGWGLKAGRGMKGYFPVHIIKTCPYLESNCLNSSHKLTQENSMSTQKNLWIHRIVLANSQKWGDTVWPHRKVCLYSKNLMCRHNIV